MILESACRHQSLEHTISAAFVAFWPVLQFRERIILYGLIKNVVVLYLEIFNTEIYIVLKISALGLFLK